MDEEYLMKLDSIERKINNILIKVDKNTENDVSSDVNFVRKTIMTIMIGAISAFEKEFGELWGYNKKVQELSEDELSERKHWDVVRKAILDSGNNQVRKIESRIKGRI